MEAWVDTPLYFKIGFGLDTVVGLVVLVIYISVWVRQVRAYMNSQKYRPKYYGIIDCRWKTVDCEFIDPFSMILFLSLILCLLVLGWPFFIPAFFGVWIVNAVRIRREKAQAAGSAPLSRDDVDRKFQSMFLKASK